MPEEKHKLSIVWFRRDLRLADNPALRRALSHSKAVLPLYIDDKNASWSESAAADAWLHHSLVSLNDDLVAKGSRLWLGRGTASTELPKLCDALKADAIYWNRMYEPASVDQDTALKSSLREAGIQVHSCQANLLFEPWQIETNTGGPYKVFTPFWRKAQALLPPREPLDPPESIQTPSPAAQSMSLAELKLTPARGWDKSFWPNWQPGEAGAREQLQRFASGALVGYKDERNIPGIEGVSRLSPHLHFGEVSPHQIWSAIATKRRELAADVECYLREIGWREFAHHVLYHFPHTPIQALNTKYRDFPWSKNYESNLAAWQHGQTGIPLVDAGMRELWQTGWMHNRIRMIVASFLVKNLRIPWLEGARWFYDTLVDADLANNTLGWQWAAGCGADAAPYFRVFNPVLQSQKFDPNGTYLRRYLPELRALSDKNIHTPWELDTTTLNAAGIQLGTDYPWPIVDLKQSRLDALAALKSLDPDKTA